MNLADVRHALRSKGIVRDEPGEFYPKWLRGRPSAAGPDGISTSTWFMERTEAERIVQSEAWLVEPVHTRAAYKEIAKPGGGTRGIATFDRSYQAGLYAISEMVGPVIEARYTDAVVGFRPGYRLDDTIIGVMSASRTDFPALLTADIFHFFDEIDLGLLGGIIDGLDELEDDLREWVKVHARTELVAPDGRIVSPAARTKGIAQGSVLAPTLANLYLLDFDRRIKKRLGFGVYRRYADNLGVVVKTTEEAARAESIIREELSRLRLKVKTGSNRIADVNNPKNAPSFLGIAWTRDRAWAEREAIAKKVEQLKVDIQLGRKDFGDVENYLDGLKTYFTSILSGEAAEEAVQQIEELLGHDLLRATKGGNNTNEKIPYLMREIHQRAHQAREGQTTRMITRTSVHASGPTTGRTNGTGVQIGSYIASERIDHGRESQGGSQTQALSGWKDGTLSTSPSTPSTFTLAEAREQGFHPRCPPQDQDAVGLDQAPRVRHALVRVDRARAVVEVRLDAARVERPVEGRLHGPTETELAGLVFGWDIAVEHGAMAVTLTVEDLYVKKYLDGAHRVGRPWNAYWLDALLARLEDPVAPMWRVEFVRRSRAGKTSRARAPEPAAAPG